MKVIRIHKKRIHAQALVEFALILPVLLAIVFGLLEVGRMVFVYVTIATASREAVRYGSATGEVTVIGSANKRYSDCSGIRTAAQRVNFLNAFTDSDIVITFDHGLDTAGNIIPWSGVGCQGGLTPPVNVAEADRINVTVTGQFIPIVDLSGIGFFILAPHTFSNSNFHTILGSVSIDKPWQGGSGNGSGGGGGGGGGGIGGALPTPTLTLEATSTLAPTATPWPSSTPNPCVVTSSTPTVDVFYTKFLWTVTVNIPVTIQSLTIQWPAGSGNLTGIILDGTSVTFSNVPPSATINGSLLPGGGNLSSGAHYFQFLFANNPLAGLFQVSLSFTSHSCNAAFGAVTLYPVTHSGSFPDAADTSTNAGPWTIYNHTGTQLYINYIKITWNKGLQCFKTADLKSFTLATYQQIFTSSNNSYCNGLSLFPTNWYLPADISTMSLVFSQPGIKNIVVEIGITGYQGNPTSYILDSSNPNQHQ